MKTIFLDLDGVVCCFVAGAAKVFNLNYEDLVSRWKLGCWDIEETLNCNTRHFFSEIEKHGYKFWAELPDFSYTKELVEFCRSKARTIFLTAPTMDPECSKGKMIWLQKRYGRNFKDYVITSRKELCANPDSILIDDKDENVEAFKKAGGTGVLFPTYSNSRYQERFDALNIVKKEIVDFVK